jgi:hypothetical protein
MLRILIVVAAVLQKHGMTKWFISHATLLGAFRHGGFIPWDVDVDVVMPRSHISLLRRVWRRELPRDMFLQSEKTDDGFHIWNGKERAIRIKDRYSTFVGMKFIKPASGKKRYKEKRIHMGAHLDIIPLERSRGRFKILHNYFDVDDVLPPAPICFENLVLPGPRNPKKFLEVIYGTNFTVPPPNASFGGETVLPCLATAMSKGNRWSLPWDDDHPISEAPKLFPRDDADGGTYLTDYKTPYKLYYNSRW